MRHSVEYRSPRFEVRERRVYVVDDTFPRIVPSSFRQGSMPAGVMRLRYYIDLTNEPPAPISEQEVEDLLARLAARQ
ncbi:MAG: PD-(D/E)XK motif protein [Chloroflexota bacterium]|nr:PD-(D/E)XK motif protein [Chloroflexota bacterium]